MHKYFTKVKSSFIKNESEILKYQGDCFFAFGIDTEELKGKTLLKYFHINDMDSFYDTVQNYNFKIPPSHIQIWRIENKGWLDVHRDRGESKTSLNYYIDTSLDETIFYTPKDGVIREDYHVYEFDELNVEDSFVARPKDAYLLNINELHSVTKHDDKPRILLQYSWNEDYETVLESIQDLLCE
jgi:hypothetical protein